MKELLLSIGEVSELIRSGETSPVDIVEATLERIRKTDGQLNSYIKVMIEEALADAKQAAKEIKSDRYRGPLHGIPIAVKDNISTSSAPTTCGSKLLLGHTPEKDATVIERLKRAGAIIIGKHNLYEFAFVFYEKQSYFGPTKNPWNIHRHTGGSSSGSAVAVAAGLCHGALGTDTGGSIRVPASLCGVVGLKPTYGQVSRYGVYPTSWTLDHVGPITRRIVDAAIMLQAISGRDGKDPTSSSRPVEKYVDILDGDIEGVRVGVPSDPFFKFLDPDVKKAFSEALKLLEKIGARIENITLPGLEGCSAVAYAIAGPEAFSFHERNLQKKQGEYNSYLKTQLVAGSLVPVQDYLRALRLAKYLRREVLVKMKKFDVVATPTCPIGATNVDELQISIKGKSVHVMEAWPRFTQLWNLVGFPVISVPCGFDRNHSPLGLQLAAKPYEEHTLFRVAHAYESRTAWHKESPII